MRPAVGEVVPRRLPFSDGDRAPVAAGRLEDPQRKRVDMGDREGVGVDCGCGERRGRLEHPEEVRLLEDDAGRVLGGGSKLVGVGGALAVRHLDDLEPEAGRIGLHDLSYLGARRFRHGDLGPSRRVLGDVARVRRDGRAVVTRGVRDVHAGELAHGGLVLEDRLEHALAQLGLVRRVGGQELAALEHGVHDRRDIVVVQACAEERHLRADMGVQRGQLLEIGGQLLLGHRGRQLELAPEPHPGRKVGEQLLDRGNADRLEHRAPVGVCQREVAHRPASGQ